MLLFSSIGFFHSRTRFSAAVVINNFTINNAAPPNVARRMCSWFPPGGLPRSDVRTIELINFFERKAFDLRNEERDIEKPEDEAPKEDEENKRADARGNTWSEEREQEIPDPLI